MARLDRILSLKLATAAKAACLATLAMLLTGCDHTAATQRDGRVVAKVNGDEITRGDLESAVEATGTDTATAVESLIDQELLVQKALASHLDRDPAVVEEIERARREILSRTYAQRSVLPHAQISAAAQREYFSSNPALFAQRRIYRTLTFSIPRAELTPTLRNALDRGRSAIHVRDLLNRHHIPFEAFEITRSAEEIPMDILPQLTHAGTGDVLIASPPQHMRALLICVVDVQDSPVDFEHATASINQHLTDVYNHTALAQYLRSARSLASISYGRTGDAVPVASADEPATPQGSSFD
jgi:EpsD family peptidyl-prolyl cis-trans isomerase